MSTPENHQEPTAARLRLHELLSAFVGSKGGDGGPGFAESRSTPATSLQFRCGDSSFAVSHNMSEPSLDRIAVFECVLGPLPQAEDARAQALHMLLGANYRLCGNGQTCFSLDSDSGDVLFSSATVVDSLNSWQDIETLLFHLEDVRLQWDAYMDSVVAADSGETVAPPAYLLA